MKKDQLTQSIEDYIKAIYSLTRNEERASTNQLAEALNITAASVSGMIKKLSQITPPLVEYEKHNGVLLTPEGEKIALEIIRHHRLLELFLHQILGYPWEKVHEEADRLEHVISEEFEIRIAEALGNPLRDPHGDPIPTINLELPPSSSQSLAELRTGEVAQVQRVDDHDPLLLSFLEKKGLVPGATITVLDFSPFDENLTLMIDGMESPVIIGPKISRQIFIEHCKINAAK